MGFQYEVRVGMYGFPYVDDDPDTHVRVDQPRAMMASCKCTRSVTEKGCCSLRSTSSRLPNTKDWMATTFISTQPAL